MQIHESHDSTAAIQYLTVRLGELARNGRVLLLLSGGSAASVGVAAVRKLAVDIRDQIMIGQVDERYGEVGHPDANGNALLAAGVVPILIGAPLEQTVAKYEAWLQAQMASADFKIALLGIGADGHTAGILPHSPALAETPNLVTSYQGPDYLRITTTPALLAQLDEAVVYASGEAKRPVLESLNEDRPAADQPAQLLKKIPKVEIFFVV